jgi:hypothetical protein
MENVDWEFISAGVKNFANNLLFYPQPFLSYILMAAKFFLHSWPRENRIKIDIIWLK